MRGSGCSCDTWTGGDGSGKLSGNVLRENKWLVEYTRTKQIKTQITELNARNNKNRK